MIGIGSDLIDIRRIQKTIERFGDRFKNRVFTKSEIEKCEKRNQSFSCFAKIFAAKEAAAKALGTGFRNGVFWKDLEVINLPSGEPTINFHGNSKNHLEKLTSNFNNYNTKLTITDEYPYAQAIVVIGVNYG